MALQGQLLGVQRLIFLSNSSMFPEFVTSGSIMFQISGPRYLKYLINSANWSCCKICLWSKILEYISLLKQFIGNVTKNIVFGIVQFYP